MTPGDRGILARASRLPATGIARRTPRGGGGSVTDAIQRPPRTCKRSMWSEPGATVRTLFTYFRKKSKKSVNFLESKSGASQSGKGETTKSEKEKAKRGGTSRSASRAETTLNALPMAALTGACAGALANRCTQVCARARANPCANDVRMLR